MLFREKIVLCLDVRESRIIRLLSNLRAKWSCSEVKSLIHMCVVTLVAVLIALSYKPDWHQVCIVGPEQLCTHIF